jgi:prepilin-type N-terminal cleavage/methylation domain-containing protein
MIRFRALTLIELLVVVAVIAILAAIAVGNLRQAIERTNKAADAANLRVIATALQNYYVDYQTLPPADREAGPFPSHSQAFTAIRNGPSSGGSWDGIPWLLHELGYISDWRVLFTPKYLKLYSGGRSNRGDFPRFHNFRYAYNSAALSSGGHSGGWGNVMSGDVWLVRNLWMDPRLGWFGAAYPDYPADYRYPWGEGEWEGRLEHALYSDFAVRTVIGGTDTSPDAVDPGSTP